MAIIKYANNASSFLAVEIDSTQSVITVDTGTGDEFPSIVSGISYFYATITDSIASLTGEIVKVTARSSDTFTVTRAQQNTASRAWPAGSIITQYVTAGDLSNFIQRRELVDYFVQPPIASVIVWSAQGSIPSDYVLCDGSEYLIDDYPYLFEIIGYQYGSPSTSAHFLVPDLRGLFIRGLNNSGSGYDPNRVIGNIQNESIQSHNHQLPQNFTYNERKNHFSDHYGCLQIRLYNTETGSTGSSETRPKNIALNYIMRARF